MHPLEQLAIALALSVDAFVCSVIYGRSRFPPALKLRYALIFGCTCGWFRFMMPLIGYAGGGGVQQFISACDHWLACALLCIVSGNMIREACHHGGGAPAGLTSISFLTVLSLAVATSIDAIALGFSIGVLQDPIMTLATLTGAVCLSVCFCGFMVGQYLARFTYLDRTLNLTGAAVLLIIALSILYGHGVFGA